ncbi:unnamed protein product [Caenorhabditis bovis]|uniref:Glutamate carboxypeptidase 2 homolog n=1 Tax=Caenorhabditis bovis TaxID=2654633 RepID=A0A8S1FED0_9PELO|nr:unnamed protein product [Caenorhabditis bovis]
MASRTCICQTVAFILFIVGALLLVAGLVIVLGVFPNIVHNQINDQKVLGLNSDGTLNSFTDSWANNNYISTMEYWVFNYTNTIGIMNRAIFPDVVEKGPYAYDEIITMDNINFTEDGEYMTFRKVQTFVFNPNKSCADCDPYKDKVLIPDIGFQLGMDQLDSIVESLFKNPTAIMACEFIMKKRNVDDPKKACQQLAVTIEAELGVLVSLFDVSPFVTVNVDQLLFSGYTTPFLDKFLNEVVDIFDFILGHTLLKPFASPPIALNALNASSDTIYTVLTGKSDPLKAGYIVGFTNMTNASIPSNGNQLPSVWWPSANLTFCKDAEHALKIEGTNADFFKNFVTREDKLPVYISDVCRSAVLTYDRDVNVKGFSAYRFNLPSSEFDYSLEENCGFCVPLKYGAYENPPKSACLPSGLLDVSNCNQGAPIIISKPHFYQADHLVERFVPRFKPNYDDDETQIDIEPNTGTVLQAKKKLQINVLVNQFKKIRSLSVMRPGAYPLVWLNESFYMDKNTEDQLNSQLFTPMLLYPLFILLAFTPYTIAGEKKCPAVKRGTCCNIALKPGCRLPRQCYNYIMANCPDRKIAVYSRKISKDRRLAPRIPIGKCGTAEVNYQPCTSKGIANKLFLACCHLYVPEECHHMCVYETDQTVTRNMLVNLRKDSQCRIKHLSSILYCASQNRDNRKCCLDLDLNAPQLQVGSRCLRMCDPSGTAIDRITKEDVTCSQSLVGIPMLKAYVAIAVSLVFCICVAAVGLHHSERRFNHYKKVTIHDIHRFDSEALLENINAENIKKYLRIFTQEPHLAGSDANKKVAYAIANAWSEAGLDDVHTLSYEVLLSYPDFDIPNSVIIQDRYGKELFRSKGVSPVIIEDEQSGKHAGHQWLAYAGNGSVSAELVYCNRGTANDFKNLKLMGVDIKGKIALIRYGHGFRGDKVYKAQLNGAIGAILFSDPSDVALDGTSPKNVYPNTIWMPNEGVQRGSLMHGDGDPLSPNYPSKKELFKSRTVEEAKNDHVLPTIPVLPISYTTAYEILSRMKGRPVPSDWQGLVGYNLTYRLGPGFTNDEKISINVHSELKKKRIRNVIGYIRGSQEPDRYVMLGNHFDAWVYGSIDPNSGTAVLAEVARAMMQTINETSWRPARTIVFNAWDAEEYGLIGSTEFVEEFVNILQKRAVVYINMDTIQGNASLHVSTIPTMEHIAVEASKRVPNPSKREKSRGRITVYDTWMKVFPDKKTGMPRMPIPGGGSDHAPFLNYAGVPVINFNYKNYSTFDTYPLYHTMYETPFTNIHLMDTDNLAVHRAIGQYWAELARTFADDVILPMNVTNLANSLIKSYLPQLKSSLSGLNVTKKEFDDIKNQYALLSKSSQDLLHMSRKFEETIHFTEHSFSQNPYDSKHINAVNDRLMSTERCFINPRGVSSTNPSARHVLFSVSDSDSYSNSLMAGVANAIDSYNSKPTPKRLREIINQISIVQYSVICVVNTLRDVI